MMPVAATVFVLGNAGIDLTLALPQLVRPGETAVATTAVRSPGGKGLNQAAAAARAGARVRFCAAVGDDADAAVIGAALARERFAELRLLAKPVPTDQSIVMVAADGENSVVSLCGCADALTGAEAAGFAAETAPGDVLLLQGNLSEQATAAAIDAAPARTVLNAAPLRWPINRLLPRCAVVVVNRGEAECVTGLSDPAAAAHRLRALGCATAIVTLGGAGCLWADRERQGHMPALAVKALDTTGAGDTFCGVLVARLARGADVPDAIATAQAAAALSVTRHGAFASVPSAAELVPR